MQGAVAGTPGTLPTNWRITGSVGTIVREVVGTGVENGVSYVDIRFSGTTSSTGTGVGLEVLNSAVAANGQTWTLSSFLKVVAGSTDNLSVLHQIRANSSTPATVQFLTSAAIPVTTTLERQSYTATITNASTEFVDAGVNLSFASGAAIDITLRIGLPQLEQGAFATSVIPTTTTALTRSADVALVDTLSPWYNASEGAVYVSATLINTPATAIFGLYALINGTSAERIYVNTGSGAGGNINTIVTDNNIAQAQTINGGLSAAGIYNYANAYKVNDFASVANGGSAVTDNLGSLPNVDRLILGANAVGNAQFLNGYLRRIAYYPRRLSNAELQAITA
jgi:hypothetical protein